MHIVVNLRFILSLLSTLQFKHPYIHTFHSFIHPQAISGFIGEKIQIESCNAGDSLVDDIV
jgi:hypothetical protein